MTAPATAARYVAPADYVPALDEGFPDAVVNDLLEHPGEWRHSGRLAAEERAAGRYVDPHELATATYKAVEVARRIGLQVDGDTHLGFRFRHWRRVRFVRLPQAMTWPPEPRDDRSHRAPEPITGQLTIHEAIG